MGKRVWSSGADMASPKIELVPLKDIKGWTRNPKLHDLKRLEESLDRFGFVAPLIMDTKMNRLVAGHGRLEALIARREKGLAPPLRVERTEDGEWLVPVMRVDFKDEKQAEAYLLADNRLVEAGGWDESQLLDMLKDLSADGATEKALAGLGWEAGDIDALSAFTSLNDGPLPGAGADQPEINGYVAPDTRARVIIVCPDWPTAQRIVEALGGVWKDGRVTYDAKDLPVVAPKADTATADA